MNTRFLNKIQASVQKDADNVVRDNNGSVREVTGLLRDITERKQAEEEHSKIQAQLVHSSRLASIGTLAAGVAHEINNPLAIIHGFLRMLREEPDNKARDRIIEKQDAAIQRIAKIVDGLRVFARSDSNRIETVNSNDVVRDTMSLTERIIRNSNIEIDLRLCEETIATKGDSGKLQQVIMNLVTNAKDAMERVSGVKKLTIETYDRGNTLEIRVSDTGCGIPQNDRKRIFDPFFTTKPPGKGTGLGLAISHQIIESFNGRIVVESTENQ